MLGMLGSWMRVGGVARVQGKPSAEPRPGMGNAMRFQEPVFQRPIKSFPKSAPARFGCKQRKACSKTGVGYGGAVSTRSGGTPVRTVRAELACLSLSVVRSGAD